MGRQVARQGALLCTASSPLGLRLLAAFLRCRRPKLVAQSEEDLWLKKKENRVAPETNHPRR